MESSDMFRLKLKDFSKGLLYAVAGGIVLPILAAIQTPDFSIFNANWGAIFELAINGGIASFAGYISLKFFSKDDKIFGKIG